MTQLSIKLLLLIPDSTFGVFLLKEVICDATGLSHSNLAVTGCHRLLCLQSNATGLRYHTLMPTNVQSIRLVSQILSFFKCDNGIKLVQVPNYLFELSKGFLKTHKHFEQLAKSRPNLDIHTKTHTLIGTILSGVISFCCCCGTTRHGEDFKGNECDRRFCSFIV